MSIQYSASKVVPYIALIIAVILYLATYMLFKYGAKVKIEALPKKRDLAIAGAFPFFIVWFAFWVLFYTLAVNAGLIII